MKQLIVLALLASTYFVTAQNNQELLKHYEAFYKQMKVQGDVQGVINGLTHLNILAPSQTLKDTLAMIYVSEGKHLQALNTIGIDKKDTDSDLAVEVKGVSLKALNEPERAIVHFDELFKRNPNAAIAYELAELNIQTNNLTEASKYTDFGINNAKEDAGKVFYDTQQPYQVSLKAAFLYLKGLIKFNENKAENIDAAIAIFEEALLLAPNFNLVKISKDALLSQKTKTEPKN